MEHTAVGGKVSHQAHTGNKVALSTYPLYEFARFLNLNYFRLFHGIKYTGVSNIPKFGPIIFAPNHISYYDPTGIAAGVPSSMRFMAWDALFSVPILKQILTKFGGYPVKLKSADKQAIAQTLRILKHGECVMIFPEGERTLDGKLGPFENGVARLALQTGATVVPVTITGAFEAWPASKAIPTWFKPICVKFHPPIYLEITHDKNTLKEKMAEVNEGIAKPIRRRLAAWEKLKSLRRK